MRKLILFSILIIAIYLVVRHYVIRPETAIPETGLETLTPAEKVKALDELKVLYDKKPEATVVRPAPQRIEKPFFEGEKEDFERLEKIQYLDERGNPVNLNEEGEP